MLNVLRVSVVGIIGVFVYFVYAAYSPELQIAFIDKKLGEVQSKFNPQYISIIKLSTPEEAFYCSGFVIDASYAVTAGHCVVQNGLLRKDDIKILNEDGDFTGVVAHAAGYAGRSDLGLVRGDFSNFILLKANITSFGFVPNHAYATCGYPYGQNKLVCTEYVPKSILNFAVIGEGYLVPGMSGGAVIDRTTGEAVGVNSFVGEGYVGVYPLEGLQGAFNL